MSQQIQTKVMEKTMPLSAKSKVREYIAEKKRWDETNTKIVKPRNIGLSLEDLYQITEQDLPPNSDIAKTELRKTLRLVKEKDMMILKLRETCHELTLKCAHAENTIDQLRFNRGGNGQSIIIRKAASSYNIANNKDKEEKEMKDQATETRVDILDECCSNWMEKVQNWKTDSALNTSGADADSGFRGSEFDSAGRKKSTLTATSELATKSPKLLFQHRTDSSSSSRNNFQCQNVGTNTENGEQEQERDREQRLPINSHSQSFNDLNAFTTTASHSHSHSHKLESRDKSLERIYTPHGRIDHFKTLDPLLDEATALARRVQRKSRKLAKLIQSVDKKI